MISAAQLLDELMGRDRNLAPDEKRSNVRWDHESVSIGPGLFRGSSLYVFRSRVEGSVDGAKSQHKVYGYWSLKMGGGGVLSVLAANEYWGWVVRKPARGCLWEEGMS